MDDTTLYGSLIALVWCSVGGIVLAGFGMIPEWLGLSIFFGGLFATLGYVLYAIGTLDQKRNS